MNNGSILKDIGDYKNTLLSTLVSSDEICELLFHKNPYTEDDVTNLIYTQIFPYLYKDETQAEVKTYICMEVDVSEIPTNTVKNMKLILWVYSHKDDMEYSKEDYSGTKVDILADMIERKLRSSDEFGIGKLQLQSVVHFNPSDNYYGKRLIYKIPTFKLSR